MDVRLETIPPLRVAFVRHVGPYDQVESAWKRLFAWAGPRGLIGPGTRMLGICHDDPKATPSDKLRYDACIAVGPTVQPVSDIQVQTIVGGQYAVTTHRGPYEQLTRVYASLMGEWLPQHSRDALAAPCFEVYLNSPASTPPEQLLTDVYVPLEPVG